MNRSVLKWYPRIAAIALLAFTIYVCLDTFVLSTKWSPEGGENQTLSREDLAASMAVDKPTGAADPSPTPNANLTTEPTPTPSGEQQVVSNDHYYSDGKITVTISTARAYNTDFYIADVVVSSPDYIKTALANDTYGKNIKAKTSDTASQNNAILAVNGDYYGARETGYVVRNGVLYRSSKTEGSDALAILADGSLKIVDENQVSCQELMDMGAWDVLSFGPGLVIDGEISVDEDEEIGHYQHNNPRTAIGQIGPLHYVFVVCDGRTSESYGITLLQEAEFMKSLGCVQAYNLDGGGSSTLYFNGNIINKPTADGKTFGERKVTDIVYIGY